MQGYKETCDTITTQHHTLTVTPVPPTRLLRRWRTLSCVSTRLYVPLPLPCDPFHLLDTTHLTHEERRHGSPWDIESNGPFAVVKSKNYRNAPAFPAHGTS